MKSFKILVVGSIYLLCSALSQADLFKTPISKIPIFPYSVENGATSYFSVDVPQAFISINSVCLIGEIASGRPSLIEWSTAESYDSNSESLGYLIDYSNPQPTFFKSCSTGLAKEHFEDGITNVKFKVYGNDVVLNSLDIVVNGNEKYEQHNNFFITHEIADQLAIENALANGLFDDGLNVTLPFAMQNVSEQELIFEFDDSADSVFEVFGASAKGEPSFFDIPVILRAFTGDEHVHSLVVPLDNGPLLNILNDGQFSLKAAGSLINSLVSIKLRAKGQLDREPLSLTGYMDGHSSKEVLINTYIVENYEILSLPMRLEIKKLNQEQQFNIEAWSVIKFESGDQGTVTVPLENMKTYALGDQLDLFFDYGIDASHPEGDFQVEFYVRKPEIGIILKETINFNVTFQ